MPINDLVNSAKVKVKVEIIHTKKVEIIHTE